MKKADKPEILIIVGEKNKVSFGGSSKLPGTIAICFAVVVLAVSLCCPNLLADVVCWFIQQCK